jgi:hypothetical protein
MYFKHASLIVAVAVLPLPSLSATYTLQPITITGANSVTATGLGNDSTIIGTYTTNSCTYGFTLKSGVVKTFPGTCTVPFVPTGIDDADRVIGYATASGVSTGFVYKDRKLISQFAIGESASSLPLPFISRRGGQVAYNYESGGFPEAFAGAINDTHQINGGEASVVTSITNDGRVGGQAFTNQGINAFVEYGGTYSYVILPGCSATYGFVNETGAFGGNGAGCGTLESFIYRNAAFTLITVPDASDLVVQGFNNKNKVVGVYSVSKGQYVFVSGGHKLTRVGAWPQAATLQAALNDSGDVVIAENNGNGFASYLGICSGADCAR